MPAPDFRSINPATGDIIATYERTNQQAIDEALKAAVKVQKDWRKRTPEARAIVFWAIAEEIRRRSAELALLATSEMGKPIAQSELEVEKCAFCFEFFAEHGPAWLAPKLVATDAAKSYVSFAPLGTVLAVMPWNFPFWQVFRAMAPILMSGNAMVLKHASNICGSALAIEEIMKSAAPEGLFASLLIGSEDVAGLIARPEIAAVTLTGSTNAGKQVASVAASYIKKQVLELGGSDAYIILGDADMELAVRTCVDGRLVNSGQSCVAAKRFVVVEEVENEFTERMLAQMQAATFGDPLNRNNKIGPLARHDLREALHKQVEESVAKGAKLLCGGYIPEGEGAYYPPTVLTDVVPGMPAYDEELFGPVASIIVAKNETDAVRIANDSIYGLGGGIFSRDRERAERLAIDLDAGNCFINSFVHSDPRLPFGGNKQSGYGRELSEFSLREFVNIKTVFIQ